MKNVPLRIALTSLLVFCVLLLVLTLGLWPWLYGDATKIRVENTGKMMMAAASPTFELGTLSGDPFFLKEPMTQLLRQTSAEYLVVYNSKGEDIAAAPKSQSLPAVPDEIRQTILRDAQPVTVEGDGIIDLYAPIWSETALDESLINESKIFFPTEKRKTGTEGNSGVNIKVLGILRLGIHDLSASSLALPTGAKGISLILSLIGAALILFVSFWWAFYKRLQPIQRGVNLLSKGNYSYRIPKQRTAELNFLGESVNAMGRTLEQLSSRIDEMASDLSHSDKQGWTNELLTNISDELATPAGSLFMNLYKLLEYITSLLKVLAAYNNIKLDSRDAQDLEDLKQDTEYDHIIGDVERLVRSCIQAIDKVKKVSTDLKNMSSTERPSTIDLP